MMYQAVLLVTLLNPAALAQGWTPTTEVTRIRIPSPYQRTQTVVNSWIGELTAWEWEDGNPQTIEGNLTLHYYDTGEWFSFNAQFVVYPDGWFEPLWWGMTGAYGGDGGGRWASIGRPRLQLTQYPGVEEEQCRQTASAWDIGVQMMGCLGSEIGRRFRDTAMGAGVGMGLRGMYQYGIAAVRLGVAIRSMFDPAAVGFGAMAGFMISMRSGPYPDCSRDRMIETYCRERTQGRQGEQP